MRWVDRHVASKRISRLLRAHRVDGTSERCPRENCSFASSLDELYIPPWMPWDWAFHAAPIESKMQANRNYYGFYSFKSLFSPRAERIEEKILLSMKAVLRSIDFEATTRRPTRPVIDFLLAPDISNNKLEIQREWRKESFEQCGI